MKSASAEPLIRASYAKTVIGSVKKLPAATRDAVLQNIGDAFRAEIREYGMLDWMPAASFAALVQAIEQALGSSLAAHGFWKACLRASLERRLLTPLRMGAIAVHGNSPRSLLKMTPQAWDLVSKHCGTCHTLDQPPNAIILRFEDLPIALRSKHMLPLWTGGSESCIERMDFQGAAIANADQLRAGRVDIMVSWR